MSTLKKRCEKRLVRWMDNNGPLVITRALMARLDAGLRPSMWNVLYDMERRGMLARNGRGVFRDVRYGGPSVAETLPAAEEPEEDGPEQVTDPVVDLARTVSGQPPGHVITCSEADGLDPAGEQATALLRIGILTYAGRGTFRVRQVLRARDVGSIRAKARILSEDLPECCQVQGSED